MPGGKPVANNFPCVSMMDWRGNGSDTARTWALQMTIDILGNEEKKVFPSNVSSSSSSSSWPLPSVVYSIGFELTSSVLKRLFCVILYSKYLFAKTGSGQTWEQLRQNRRFVQGKRVILVSNTNSSATSVSVPGATGAKAHTVDEHAGYGETPYSTKVLTGEELQLAPSAYVLLELPHVAAAEL